MAAPFRSYEHLLRLAALFAIGITLFVVARWRLAPADYGLLGSYRAGAIAQNQARPIAYAGQSACIACHSDVDRQRKTNAHERVSCETCHGPLAPHAADPATAARKPDARAVCASCHTPDRARPPFFKTVAFDEHADPGPCTSCHPAHAPKP